MLFFVLGFSKKSLQTINKRRMTYSTVRAEHTDSQALTLRLRTAEGRDLSRLTVIWEQAERSGIGPGPGDVHFI